MKSMPPRKPERRNPGASVRALLLNIARNEKRDYNSVLVQFAQERFLYRLSVSPFSSHFILKGALLLRAYPLPVARPTRDIDLLGHEISSNLQNLEKTFRAILKTPHSDGVDFLPETITVEEIAEHTEYIGARAKVRCLIGGAKLLLQIDVGFGDVVVPGPVEMDFPVLLQFPSPHLRVYSLESSIAEKFEALARLGLLTSRMKDIYDVLFIATHHSFGQKILHGAIAATFSQRDTSLDAITSILSDTFSANREKQKQWSAFMQLQGGDLQLQLPEAINRLQDFIEPVLHSDVVASVWDPASWKWK